MKRLFILLLFCVCRVLSFAQSESNDIITYDTAIAYVCLCGTGDGCKVSGTQQYFQVRISRPRNYFTSGNADTASRPLLLTMQGDGETGSTFINNYGPHYWLDNGWNGALQLVNGTHYPLLITVMQQADNTRPQLIQQLLDTLFKEFHPRSVHMAGLSGGVEVFGWYMMYEHTAGDEHNMANIKSFVDLMGVSPANNISLTCGTMLPYISGFGYWAHKYGGRFWGLEGSNDTRNIWQITESMNDSVPNSAYFAYEDTVGGTHCCWNDFYNPAVTNWQNITTPYGNTMIVAKTSPAINSIGNYYYNPSTGSNVFQWMLRQGDTTLVGGCAPLVSAGSNQSIQLPTNSATQVGSVTFECGASSSTQTWSQTSGPNTAGISAPSSLTTNFTGLITGTYVFQLNLTDNNGGTGQSNVTITVLQEQSPTVSAGSNQVIQLPNSTTTLIGSANGNGGATIPSNDTVWTQVSGPNTAIISTPNNSATSISGLNVSGAYVFQLSVTDNNGNSAHSQVTVAVNPQGTVNVRPVTIIGPGEYQTFLINQAGRMTSIGDNLLTQGVGGAGTAGLPLPVVGASGTTLPVFRNTWGGLHNGCEIDTLGNVWCQGDNGNGSLAQGNNTAYNYVVEVTRDSAGNPFTNVVQMSSIYVGGSNGSQGWTAIKGDGTLWVWGQLAGGARLNGTDSTHSDSTSYYPVQVTIPGGRSAKKVQGGQIIIVLATDGTVWTGCRPAFTQDLGYSWTGTQYQTLHQIASGAADIAGGGGFNYYIDSAVRLYGWGSYGTCLGGAGSSGRGTPIATPTLLTTLQSYFDAPIAQIGVNAVASYCITTKGSMYAWGDNAQGNIGIGSETNFNDSSSTQKPYAWNFGTVNIPIQYPVKILSGIQAFFVSQPFCFYTYAEDSVGNLFTWGRNKGGVLGNGVIACSANNDATYPNAWDVTTPTKVYPYNLLYTIIVWCPWCNIYPAVTPCNQCTPATNGAPIITVAGGNTQNTNGTSMSISSTAVPATGIKLSSVLWNQSSGPTTASNSSPATAATTFGGLVSGTYIFTVLWTDQNDKQSTQNVTINVSGNINCNCVVLPYPGVVVPTPPIN